MKQEKIKLEISNDSIKFKPEIKNSLSEASERAKLLIEMGYNVKFFNQSKDGKWTLLKTPKMPHLRIPKMNTQF